MPETLMLPPGGGAGDVDGDMDGDVDGDADGLVVLVLLGDGPGTIGVELMPPGVVGGDSMIDRTPENWCAATAAMPPASASMPTTMTVPRIHHVRLPDGRCGGAPGNVPPYVHGPGGGGVGGGGGGTWYACAAGAELADSEARAVSASWRSSSRMRCSGSSSLAIHRICHSAAGFQWDSPAHSVVSASCPTCRTAR
jgi:hypothetical protein